MVLRPESPGGSIVTTRATLLAIIAGLLTLFGFASFVLGEFLLGGLCFLMVSMTIYLRETRA